MSEDFRRWVDTARMLMNTDIECRSWESQIDHKNNVIKNLTSTLAASKRRCARRQVAVDRRDVIIDRLRPEMVRLQARVDELEAAQNTKETS